MKYTSPRQAFIEAYLSALRLRDLETCRHSLRVSRLAYEMARELAWSEAVSYTHLDVYKRQV